MNKKIFSILVIVLLALNVCVVTANQFPQLEINFPITLTVYALKEGSTNNGSGHVSLEDISFSLNTLPSLNSNSYNIKIDQPFDQVAVRTQPVEFKVVFILNGAEKIVTINEFIQAGRYKGTVTCYFDGCISGNYQLTVSLLVNGVDYNDFNFVRTIHIP